jgi:hypothetical protein
MSAPDPARVAALQAAVTYCAVSPTKVPRVLEIAGEFEEWLNEAPKRRKFQCPCAATFTVDGRSHLCGRNVNHEGPCALRDEL